MTLTINKPASFRSPLRYPGGKQRAADTIAQLIHQHTPHGGRIASPFFGGGSVELKLASMGYTVVGSDFFRPVAAFWQQLKADPQRLHTQIMEFCPPPSISKRTFYQLQDELRALNADPTANAFELAWRFFVINRSSFSGATLSGGMATGDRFNRNAVNRLLGVAMDNITVKHGDYYRELFDRKRRRFRFDAIYADPPYCLEVSKLYGDKGSTHDGFNHARFAQHMNWCRKQGVPIVISYNDCPEVRQLFAGWNFRIVQWAYGMNASKQSNEVLITSF